MLETQNEQSLKSDVRANALGQRIIGKVKEGHYFMISSLSKEFSE